MALLGYNGGLRGKPRIPSTGNASGLWDLEEQKIAKGAGIWPATTGSGFRYYRFTEVTSNGDTWIVIGELQLRGAGDAILQGTYTTNMGVGGGAVDFLDDSDVNTAVAIPFPYGENLYIQVDLETAQEVNGFRQSCLESLYKQILTFKFSGSNNGTDWTVINPLVTMPDLPAIATLDATTVPLSDFSRVSLLLHMGGSNGSTALIDSSSNAISFTANLDAQISTAQSRFGGSSAYFDGNGDSFSTTNLSPFEFGTGDFTVECWVYMTNLGTYNGIIDTRSSPSFDNLVFGIWNVSGTLRLDHVSSNSSARLTATSTGVALNTWTYVAWTRRNGTLACFVDGFRDSATASNSGVISPGGTTAYIGQVIDPTYFNGYIDELRITKGVCRYNANFTPPTAPFPNS